MNRRDALSRVTMIFGGTIIGAEIFLQGCKPGTEQMTDLGFTPENIKMLDEVGDTIIPDTPSSPGAKAAKIGEFMNVMVTDCYEKKDQELFLQGIVTLNEEAQSSFGSPFVELSNENKVELLERLDTEAKNYMGTKKEDEPNHYFAMMKQLTVWGYFSSEVGATQALRYVETPGKWEACIDYKKGDKAWAI